MKLTEQAWFQQLLGFDPEQLPDNAEARLVWTNAPHSGWVFVWLAVALGIGYATWKIYQQENADCPVWTRRLLAILRIAALLVLAVICLGPAVGYTQRSRLPAEVVLLRDRSQSMRTADQYVAEDAAAHVASALDTTVEALRAGAPSRAAIVDAVLAREDGRFLRQLEQRGKLRIADFADVVTLVETRPPRSPQDEQPPQPLANLTPDGRSTDLVGAVLAGLTDPLTAAVILFTDGQHIYTEQGHAELQAAAKRAATQGVPLLFVGVGDPLPPRNLAVTEVYADPQVWQDDPFEIQASVRGSGVEGETVRFQLLEQLSAQQGSPLPEPRPLAEQQLVFPDNEDQLRVVFEHKVAQPGRHSFLVRAAAIEGELTADDNAPPAPTEVKVLSQKARILLIAGAPTWEYQAVQRLLTREKTVELSCWLQTLDAERPQPGNRPILQLPPTRESLFEYDVVMLFDPEPSEFSPEWLQWLDQFVREHAGGVLYMAGPKHAGRFLANPPTRQLQDLLPVRFDDVAELEVRDLLSSKTQAWPLGVVAANVDQPIMRFFSEPEESLTWWRSLPGVFWSFPSNRAKPAARVLIEHTDPSLRELGGPRPILVTGQYGSGRTVFFGFNGTWRWRRVGQNSEYFNRFWVQTTRYLVEGRTLEGRRRGIAETDRSRYELGDQVTVTARLKDASYRPLDWQSVPATLRLPTGGSPQGQERPLELQPIPNRPGEFAATFTSRQLGRHVLSVRLGADVPARIEATFNVTSPSAESNEIWLNKPLLTELAQISGGGYFEIDEADEVLGQIVDRSRTIEVEGKPVPLWDTGRVLLLLVGLFGVEWGLRKRFKLL